MCNVGVAYVLQQPSLHRAFELTSTYSDLNFTYVSAGYSTLRSRHIVLQEQTPPDLKSERDPQKTTLFHLVCGVYS